MIEKKNETEKVNSIDHFSYDVLFCLSPSEIQSLNIFPGSVYPFGSGFHHVTS